MILVTGATGYIGSRLVKKLADDGHNVRAMVIENDPLLDRLEGVGCEIVTGDITRKETLTPCLAGVKTVIHLAAVLVSGDPELFHKINYEGTKNVVDTAVEQGAEHFIFISAAAAVYRKPTTYGRSKIQSEALMKQRGNTNFTIIRPTLLYGSGGSQELKIYVENLRKFPLIVPTVGRLKARKRPVWVGDIVNGLSLLVNKPVTYGKTYNFSGGTELSMWEYTELICKQFGISKPMIPVPVFLCYAIAAAWKLVAETPPLRKDLILGVIMDANGSYQEALEDIGYQPVDLYEKFAASFEDQSL